jgi:hypothetical protein
MTDDKTQEKKRKKKDSTWRPPTRRAFVQMIGAAAAALAIRDRSEKPKPIWIGHF